MKHEMPTANRDPSSGMTTQPPRVVSSIIESMVDATDNDLQTGRERSRQRLPQELVDELLERTNIISIIRESTALRESTGKPVAHCPFHRTGHAAKPSMTVDSATQRFDCSVCGFGGSAIGWLMYHDGLSFHEAILALAVKAGVDVSRWISSTESTVSLQDRLDTLRDCSDLYAKILKSADGDNARAYLESRGLSNEMIALYRLGLAPGGIDKIEAAFPHRARELWRYGVLARYADKSYSQRFAERLVFPILSRQGDVVAFGGRTLSDRSPKYLNSATSPVFQKRETLYGWPQAFDRAESRDAVFLVEGYLDVISLAQAGIRNVVGALGTACSEMQLRDLASNTSKIICCFDSDTAGGAAAVHTLHVALPFLSEFDELRFLFLPSGHDPDSFVRSLGAQTFLEHSESAISAEDLLFDTLVRDINPNSVGDLARLASVARELVSSIDDPLVRSRLVSRLDRVIGVSWFEVEP